VKYCDQCDCMSVCPRAYLKNDISKFHKIFSYMLPVAVAQSSSDDTRQCNTLNVLPVLSMTLFAHNGLYGAWLRERIVKVTSAEDGMDSIPACAQNDSPGRTRGES